MSRYPKLDRRTFLKSAGATAAMSAIGGRNAFAAESAALGMAPVARQLQLR